MSRRRRTGSVVLRNVTRERSLLMARVRRSGTAPELALRSALHRAGYRYRLNSGCGLPGTPDIVLRRFRLAIFVDGCFWHGCKQHGSKAKTNSKFWSDKILRNQQRDAKVDQALSALGWKVFRVWEHEVRLEMRQILRRIRRLITPL
jgi:DNA mismatch endonuclease (patch repair protein)